MASSNDTLSMALFCDFENVALGVRDAKFDKFDIKLVLERLLLKGSIVVKKAYCDWDRYKSFKGAMHEANFELIEIPHVRQSGKNSADIRLVVDALDLCYTKSHVNTFVIISGDSDFSPLVSKLRENAKQVIGIGVQQSTSDLLIANCDEFFFYDDLVRESQRSSVKREPSKPQQTSQPATKRAPDEDKSRKEDLEKRRTKAIEIAVQTFDALASERGDSGKIWASVLKNAIKRRKPDFNETYYGFRAFGNLLEEAHARGLLEFGRDEKSGAYVYRSTAAGLLNENSSNENSSNENVDEQATEQMEEVDVLEAASGESNHSHEQQEVPDKREKHDKQDKHRGRGRGNRSKSARGQQESHRDVHTGDQHSRNAESPFVNEPLSETLNEPLSEPQPDTTARRRDTTFVTEPESYEPGIAEADANSDTEARSETRKPRTPRKTAAKKTAKSTRRTADEPTAIASPPEPGQSGEPAQTSQTQAVAAKKPARKSAPRSRRPRNAATTNDAE